MALGMTPVELPSPRQLGLEHREPTRDDILTVVARLMTDRARGGQLTNGSIQLDLDKDAELARSVMCSMGVTSIDWDEDRVADIISDAAEDKWEVEYNGWYPLVLTLTPKPRTV